MGYVAGERQPWQRWWLPVGKEAPLANGLLNDPAGRYGEYLAPDLVGLEECLDTRCLVLLGAPGIGKSDELDREEERWQREGGPVVRVDLGAQTDWSSLQAAAFSSDAVRQWLSGEGELAMLLDSFDEAVVTIDKLTDALLQAFSKLPHERLRLRIAGRPSIWPERLTRGLEATWSGSFAMLALAPLTAEEVRHTAQRSLGNGEAFLGEVLQRELGALAGRPITLGMLLRVAEDGPLPDHRLALYAQAVEMLVAEQNERRREERRDGPPVADRIAAAEALATASVLSARPRVSRRREAETPDSVLTLDDLSDTAIPWRDLEAVWDSGVFSAGAGGTLAWVHRTVAEYLCGRRLARLPFRTAHHLLSDAAMGERVVPQLSGVAAWAAYLNPEIFGWVVSTDPDMLLTPDLRTAPPQRRRDVGRALIARLAAGRPPGDWRSYRGLDYPEFAADLAPLLEPTKSLGIRREALHMLAHSGCRELDHKLMKQVEDVATRHGPNQYTDEVSMAELIVHTLRRCGRPEILARATALAKNSAVPQSLRVELVNWLWPHVEIQDVLSWLEGDLFGRRRSRLSRDVTDGLIATLEAGAIDSSLIIDWLNGHQKSAGNNEDFARLAGAAVLAAVHAGGLDEKRWRAVGRLCARQAAEWQELFHSDVREEATGLPPDKRRRLVLETLRADNSINTALTLEEPGLLSDKDFEHWLLTYARSLDVDADVEAVAFQALRFVARLSDENIAVARRVAERYPAARGWVDSWASAKNLKPRHKRATGAPARQLASNARTIAAHFSPERLDRHLSNEDWNAVTDELRLPLLAEPRKSHVAGLPLSHAPVWATLDRQQRRHVLDLALAYLSPPPSPPSWQAASSVGDAYSLLHSEVPDRLGELSGDALVPWLRELFEVPAHATTAASLLEHLAPHHPDDVERIVVEGVLADGNQQWARFTSRIGDYTTEAVEDVLANVARAETTSPWVLDDVLPALMSRDPERAGQMALQIVDERPASPPLPAENNVEDLQDPRVRAWERAVSAAVALLSSPSLAYELPRVLNEFEASNEFAQAVIRRSGSSFADPKPWSSLDADQLATVYLWAKAHLPQASPQPPGTVIAGNAVHEFPSRIFGMIQSRADTASAEALDRIAAERDSEWAKAAGEGVRSEIRAKSWNPPSPTELASILADPARRVIASEAQLAQVLLDALDDVDAEIRSNPDVRAEFWHRQHKAGHVYAPLNEREFTTRLVGRLRLRVRSVAVLRQEVQLHLRLAEQPGSLSDIEAIVQGAGDKEFVVIAEVKCNYNSKVGTSLEEQLARRYLATDRSRTGIYIVAWYAGDAWDPEDSRKGRVRGSSEALLARLRDQAAGASAHGRVAHVRLIDLTLSPPVSA